MSDRYWADASRLVVRRLGDGPRSRNAWPWVGLRRRVTWLAAWVGLAGGIARVLEDAAAALFVRPPHLHQRLRHGAVCLGVAALAVALLGVLPGWVLGNHALAVVVYFAILAVCMFGAALVLFAVLAAQLRLRSQDHYLKAFAPPGGWYLYNFVGDPNRPGSGQALLERECREADRRGRVLYLDTLAPRDPSEPNLVGYYGELGFGVAARVDVELVGEELVIVRMVRDCLERRSGRS